MNIRIPLTVLVIALYVIFYICLEHFKRRANLESLQTRRLAHIISGLGAVGLFFLLETSEYVIVLSFFTLFFAFSLRHRIFSSIHLQERKTLGEVVYPMGLLVALEVAAGDPLIFVGSTLVMSLADPLASYVGGRTKQVGKTNNGSLAFFLCALIVLGLNYLVFREVAATLVFAKLFVIAGGATLVERVSPYGLDNLTVPAFLAVTLSLL